MSKYPDVETKVEVPEAFKPLLEDLRKLTKDQQNPNRMTKRAREGLWRSMQKYGWIYPILVDQKGMLGDGEQRLETCLAHKEYYGPVLRLDVDDVDRRLLRQITNKLRGTHDPDKDLLEYQRLIEGGRRKELISILKIREKELREALEKNTVIEETQTGRRVVEAIAAMARYNPFLEKAGMTLVGEMEYQPHQKKLVTIIENYGSHVVTLHSPRAREAFINGLTKRQRDKLTNQLMKGLQALRGQGGQKEGTIGRGIREADRMMKGLADKGLTSLLGDLLPTKRIYLYWENPDPKIRYKDLRECAS